MSSNMNKVLHIKIVSDVICPFCYLGLRYMQKACQTMLNTNSNFKYVIEWEPFFLNPNQSLIPDDGIPIVEYLSKKYGNDAGKTINDPNSPMNRSGQNVGIIFNPNRRAINTLKAHVWIEYMKQNYSNDIVNHTMEQFLNAYHVQGKNISNNDILYNIIINNIIVNIDRITFDNILNDTKRHEEVYKKHEEYTKNRNIHGVPYFIITTSTTTNDNDNNGGEICFSGAQPSETMIQYLKKAL